LRFAKFENVTQIVIGRSRDSFWSELLHRSLPHELVRRTQDIAIPLVTRKSEGPAKTSRFGRPESLARSPLHFVYASLAGAAGRRWGSVKLLPGLRQSRICRWCFCWRCW